MTMEMWWLGFYMDRFRLCLFLILAFPVLVGLSYHAGFEKTFRFRDDVMDAFIAYAIGFIGAAAVLWAFGVLTLDVSVGELIGKVSVQAVPASMGAILARSQLGGEKARERERSQGGKYLGEMFLMAAGALFFSFNVAPTEEMVLITYKIAEARAIGLMLGSLAVMHAFTYTLGFKGQAEMPAGTCTTFLHFTLPGYALSLLISYYVLWTFGRLDDLAFSEALRTTVVLGFPAALGAAASRLIL
jgi:putative integral membrane protein (TIGR02587 family)